MSKETVGGTVGKGDLGEKLHKSFHLAGLRMLSEMGLTGPHQSEALQTIRHYEQLRRKVEKDYRASYDDRVTAVMKKLVRQAGQKDDIFQPAWGGRDVFDKTAMRHQAERQVRFAHQTSMTLLDTQETRDLEAIAARADELIKTDQGAEKPRDLSHDRRGAHPFKPKGRPRPRD